MPINPGNSALDAIHPIHEYHNTLRSEGYKYKGSTHRKSDFTGNIERENTYKAPGKPKVTVSSTHEGINTKEHKDDGIFRDITFNRTKSPKVSSTVHHPTGTREVEPGVFATKTSLPHKGNPEGSGPELLKKEIIKSKKRLN